MEKQNKFEKFKQFIEQFDKYIKTKDFKEIHKIFPLIDSFEENFLTGYRKRKIEGTFYTNRRISDFIIIETLICLINKKLNQNNPKTKKIRNLDELLKFDQDLKNKIVKILLNITICDPACGAGGFLLSAADIIYDTILKLNHQLSDTQIKNQLLTNLNGFDINQFAIKLCLLKLLKWSKIENKTRMENLISILQSNLQVQNSITTSKFPKYDIIIGNPPYGNILNQEEKEILRKENIFYKDIYCTFLIKALQWSNEFISFLVPKSFLLRQGYINFRNNLLSKANILQIYDIGSKMFKNATNEVQIVIYENMKNHLRQDLTIFDYPRTKIITYPNQDVDSLKLCFNLNCPLSLKSKKLYVYTFNKRCPHCNSNTYDLNRIRIKPKRKLYQILEKIEKTGDLNYLNPIDYPRMIRGEEDDGLNLVKRKLRKDTSGSCFFISARNDFNYYILNKNKSFNIEELDPKILKGNNYEYYRKPKLLIKHNNIIPEATFTNENVCFTSSIYSLLHNDISELKYLSAIFNSIVIQFYCIYAINNQKDTTINLNQYMIRHLPIIKPDKINKSKIIENVDMIDFLLLKNNGAALHKYYQVLREIDNIVFQLYSISESEKNLILSGTKNQIKHFRTVYGK